ncbi:MAG TPA: amidohydrolase family protein [Streptosporangiaceae bacterium]|nr:amidohydrolase family protein [Streptosporangiaceae bacterium]
MDLNEMISGLPLVDHHVHTALGRDVGRPEFELLITESGRPGPAGTTWFDSQPGLAIRRWCAPVLGLDRFAEPDEYLARRAGLGGAEVARRLLRASGIARYLIDTGYEADNSLSLAAMAETSGARMDEIVRLEPIAEQLATASGGDAASFAGRFRDALWQQTTAAVGLKCIIAYRFGLDFEPEPPSAAEVTAAAGRWLAEAERSGRARLTDPVLLRHVLWAGAERGLPLQLHTGYGDRDLDLRRCDPLLLTGFLRAVEPLGVPVMLLHCYPYHREAGYLAEMFRNVYIDVGLALTHAGTRAEAIVAESMEVAPFAKVLFSSDACGLPELHYLGALLWRRATASVLGGWAEAGDWSRQEAARIASMIGVQNALRVYRLAGSG